MSAAVEKLIAGLEEAGFQPRELYPGVWVASCPVCRRAGLDESLIEVRDQPPIVTCLSAHEPLGRIGRVAA